MIFEQKTLILGWTIGTSVISTSSYNYLDYPAPANSNNNICSSKYGSDKNFMGDLITEMWSSFGVKIIFYKTTYDTNYDKVFGEDNHRFITEAWDVMSFFQLPKENKVWDKFGINGINDFSIYMSKTHFREATDDYIPRMGDLVLSPYNNKLYEITEVKEEAPMFMMSKQYGWELIVKKAKIQNELSLVPELSASPISAFYSVPDIYDIKDQVDVEKEEIIYEPIIGEKPNNDPFGNW